MILDSGERREFESGAVRDIPSSSGNIERFTVTDADCPLPIGS